MQEAKTIQEYKVYHYTFLGDRAWAAQERNSCGIAVVRTYIHKICIINFISRVPPRTLYCVPCCTTRLLISESHSVKTVDRVTITAMTIAVLCIFTCMAGECRRCANCNENNYACINVEAAVEVNSPGTAGRWPTQEFRE